MNLNIAASTNRAMASAKLVMIPVTASAASSHRNRVADDTMRGGQPCSAAQLRTIVQKTEPETIPTNPMAM
jgi:hypothetical protein